MEDVIDLKARRTARAVEGALAAAEDALVLALRERATDEQLRDVALRLSAMTVVLLRAAARQSPGTCQAVLSRMLSTSGSVLGELSLPMSYGCERAQREGAVLERASLLFRHVSRQLLAPV